MKIYLIYSVKASCMKELEKYYMVCFDEISLKCHLFNNTKDDEIVGFHDTGEKEEFKETKLACVFVTRGIFSNWKQPLAYEFSNLAFSSLILYKLFIKTIYNIITEYWPESRNRSV